MPQMFNFFRPRARPRSTRGFALLITITLLAFLVLLLVSLASLTRVETQVASNNQSLSQARQNALMALNIALGQLQKTAGPDQRVTATADLSSGAGGVRVANTTNPTNTASINAISNGLTQVQSGTRYWTGVWGNSDPSAPTVGNGNIYEKTPSPVLLNWLVSGNETATFNASVSAGAFGQITASNGGGGTIAPTYNPANTVTGLSTGMNATTAVTVKGDDAILLVGPRSAGTDLHPTTNEPAVDRYVVAPLVNIAGAAGTVPGLAASATPTIGRYAYWIGDEGVKARINLTDPYASRTNTGTQQDARYRLLTAPRTGMEIVPDLASSAYITASQTGATADKVLDVNQATLIDSVNLAAPKLTARFHNFTTHATGLLSDSYNGGLRKDLTSDLESPTLGSWTGTNGTASGTGHGIIPTAYSPANGANPIPRWNVVHDFNTLASTLAATGSAPMTTATIDRMGLTPVISQVRIMSGFQIMNPTATPGTVITARAAVSPLFVISNPYSVPLTSSGPLRFTISLNSNMNSSAAAYIRYVYGTTTGTRWIIGPGAGGALGGPTFETPGAVTIPAGGSKIYRMNTYTLATEGVHALVEGPPSASTFNGIYEEFTFTPATPGGNNIGQLRLGENDSTTLIDVRLMDSAGNVLQELNGLNLDLPYVGVNNVTIDSTTPIPCGVFVFDLNLPGQRDYGSINGVHNSTLRPYGDFNLRASRFRFVKRVQTVAPYNWRTAATSELSATPPYGIPSSFTDDTTTLYWGRALSAADSNGVTQSILFDLPRRSATSEIPLFSLAQLQHANLTADSVDINPAHQPGYAVGNSYQSPLLRRGASFQDSQDLIRRNSGDITPTVRYFDLSYLLNASLWDGYFLSTVPGAASGAAATPANPRLFVHNDSALTSAQLATTVRDTNLAASALLVDGAFNINSTSIDAWAALLGGMSNLPALSPADTAGAANATFARSIHQPGGWANARTGDTTDAFQGFRKLTPAQVRALASAIVSQVRLRGPFVSLAQFINRTLVDATADTNGIGLYGPLQAAIDASTDINTLDFDAANTTDQAKIPPANSSDLYVATTDTKGTFGLFHANPVATVADGTLHYATSSGTALSNKRSIGIPGWLTQADVLQAIGPVLSARSDTFVIRTYGEVRNPVTNEITGRAWCEAVVQRLPEYIDGGTGIKAPETAPAATNAINQTFGRRLKIASFRWLSPEDI